MLFALVNVDGIFSYVFTHNEGKSPRLLTRHFYYDPHNSSRINGLSIGISESFSMRMNLYRNGNC